MDQDLQDHQLEQKPPRRLTDYEVDELAAEAQSLLNNEVFNRAMQDVYSRAVGTLLNADVGSLTASTAHATMKAIRDIKNQLEQYITDKKMRQRFSSKKEV